MKKLIVLEYSTSTVHIYNIDRLYVDDEYIESLGFNLEDCNWMKGDLDILYHKGVLL